MSSGIRKDEIELDSESGRMSGGYQNIDEFLNRNRIPVAVFLIGLIFLGSGLFLYKQGLFASKNKVEVISADNVTPSSINKIVVEIAGAIEKPGVYELNGNSRIEDLLIVAGGVSASADREWVEKNINRAARLVDGQKLYILRVGEQSSSTIAKKVEGIKVDQSTNIDTGKGLVNINTASLSELDSLPGIGQVYGQSIIEHRPYSSPEELISKGALKQGVYDKLKDLISTY